MADPLSGSPSLRRSVAAHSVRPAGGPDQGGPEVVIVVPPPRQGNIVGREVPGLRAAFIEAERLLGEGLAVRVAAFGPTIEENWPDWARSARGLTLTELGAYRVTSPIITTRELVPDVAAWLDRLFGDLIPELGNGMHFYASACSRLLQPWFDAWPYARGLAEAHPGARFRCVEVDWAGLPQLRVLVEAGGGTVETSIPRPRRAWRARVIAGIAYHFARAAAGQLRSFIRASRTRRRLRDLRQRSASPPIWLALVPDWPRINAHAHEAVTAPLLANSVVPGALLCTTLASGERAKDGRPRDGKSLWPGLGPLETEQQRPIVDQAVGPETWLGLVRMLIVGAARCMRIAGRLVRGRPRIAFGPAEMNVMQSWRDLAALCTTDVLQALGAAAAVRRLVTRYDFAGRPVVFSALSLVDTATVEALLRNAGARTIDFKHGAGGDGWYGIWETQASEIGVWTRADQKLARQLGSRSILFSPPRATKPVRASGPIRNVLFLTGYVHGDWRASNFAMLPFQTEMLRSARFLGEAHPGRFAFLWRPHPADDAELVAASEREFPQITRSGHSALAEDLEWADAVITYGGSTMALALLEDVPVFVHVMPSIQSYPDVQEIAAERRFFYARDLVQPFLELVAKLDRRDPEALRVDQRARSAVWGESRAVDFITSLGADGAIEAA